ncbi:MAG: hypothetical protein ACI9CU_000617, partial [Polaribacter sp.]
EMVEKGLAFTISNQSELNNKLDVLLEKNQSQLNSEVLSFMNARTGATSAILEYTNKC